MEVCFLSDSTSCEVDRFNHIAGVGTQSRKVYINLRVGHKDNNLGTGIRKNSQAELEASPSVASWPSMGGLQ